MKRDVKDVKDVEKFQTRRWKDNQRNKFGRDEDEMWKWNNGMLNVKIDIDESFWMEIEVALGQIELTLSRSEKWICYGWEVDVGNSFWLKLSMSFAVQSFLWPHVNRFQNTHWKDSIMKEQESKGYHFHNNSFNTLLCSSFWLMLFVK
jgi:hypothetical protein